MKSFFLIERFGSLDEKLYIKFRVVFLAHKLDSRVFIIIALPNDQIMRRLDIID